MLLCLFPLLPTDTLLCAMEGGSDTTILNALLLQIMSREDDGERTRLCSALISSLKANTKESSAAAASSLCVFGFFWSLLFAACSLNANRP